MSSIALSVFLDSEFGEITELPHAGTGLEHPLVFDSAAREIRDMAEVGRVEVIDMKERVVGADTLIDEFSFRRLA